MPESHAIDTGRTRALLAAVDRLDVSLKGVLLLRDLQEMSYDEISEVLGLPLGTVKSRLFRARLALRAVLMGDDRVHSEVADE